MELDAQMGYNYIRADPRLLAALRKTVSLGGGGVYMFYTCF